MGFALFEWIRPSVPVIGLVVALLLAATFFSLPYLTMLNFILTTALITTLFFITLFLLFEVLRTIDTETSALRFFSTGIALLALGGLGGTGLAYVILRCSSTLPYYDELFRFLPAVFILIIIVVLLLSFRNIAALVKKRAFEKELDTSKLEDRCYIVTQRHGLTKREGEVLTLLAMGRNVPSIAETLLISAATVKTHVLHIYRKIGVSSRQELLNVMYDEGGDKWTEQPFSVKTTRRP
jgi:DNA-binding CsgD family transcriptional regulator